MREREREGRSKRESERHGGSDKVRERDRERHKGGRWKSERDGGSERERNMERERERERGRSDRYGTQTRWVCIQKVKEKEKKLHSCIINMGKHF